MRVYRQYQEEGVPYQTSLHPNSPTDAQTKSYHTLPCFIVNSLPSQNIPHCKTFYIFFIPGCPPKKTEQSFFLGLCSNTLLDRASFPHYNNNKIIKFGWELFILWIISYGLSFSGFAISLSLIVPRNSGNQANPENDSQ